jgi:hypothetical protein
MEQTRFKSVEIYPPTTSVEDELKWKNRSKGCTSLMN